MPRRLRIIAAIVAVIVLGNIAWDPAPVDTTPEPTPSADAECWYRYQPSVGFDLWETVEVCE